jgi:hypothetical protein
VAQQIPSLAGGLTERKYKKRPLLYLIFPGTTLAVYYCISENERTEKQMPYAILLKNLRELAPPPLSLSPPFRQFNLCLISGLEIYPWKFHSIVLNQWLWWQHFQSPSSLVFMHAGQMRGNNEIQEVCVYIHFRQTSHIISFKSPPRRCDFLLCTSGKSTCTVPKCM